MRGILIGVRNALITLWIAVTVAFGLARLTGDPARVVAGPFATPEDVAEIRRVLGFDEPLWSQYRDYIWDLLQGRLGDSLLYEVPNATLIAERLPYSLQLAVAAFGIAIVVGVPLGMLAAMNNGRLLDRWVSSFAVLGQSVPQFWIGLILIWVFAINLGWFPAGQAGGLMSLILPACTLASLLLAQIARLTRSSMASVLEEDYILSAKARGLGRGAILFRHALRNAALPIITILGVQVGTLLSGAVAVEVVFSWPGLGSLVAQAVSQTDFALVQSLVVIGALVFVVVNFAIDVVYRVVDPRIRVGER